MKIAVVYASKRGKTESVAKRIFERVSNAGYSVVLLKASETHVDDLMQYDFLLLGSSTWADGDLEEGFYDLEREMHDLDLTGKYASCFGTGNKRFPRFCEAVEILTHRVKNCGAAIRPQPAKIDQLAGQVLEDADSWSENLIAELKSINS